MYWIDKQYLIFNGKSTLDFECRISGGGRHNSSSWDIQRVQIPGRDGDVYLPNNRVGNIDVTYKASIGIDFERNFKALRDFLMQDGGYHRLEDTYDPDIFMVAKFEGDLNPNIHQSLEGAEFELKFSAKPMRYLKSGEYYIEHRYNKYAEPLILKNPTNNYANPFFELEISTAIWEDMSKFALHAGNIYGQDRSLNDYYKLESLTKDKWPTQMRSDNGYAKFYIDSELQEIWADGFIYNISRPEDITYFENVNCNGMFTITNDKFPRFEKGINHVTLEIRDKNGNRIEQYSGAEWLLPNCRVKPRWFLR